MINITQQEFIGYLERYSNNEITMTQLIKELESDYRTINNKILEISVENPNLYYKIIVNHPFKQKSRTDIDFEGLMIYILKQEITINQAIDIFNVSRRTIQRRVNEIKETNPNLYKLFKDVIGPGSKKKTAPELQEKIDALEYKTVILGDVNDEREAFLEDLEQKFNNLLIKGLTQKQAAEEMGYSSYRYIYKALNELYRIKIEKNVKKQAKASVDFRNELSDMSNYTSYEKSEENGQAFTQEMNEKNDEIR